MKHEKGSTMKKTALAKLILILLFVFPYSLSGAAQASERAGRVVPVDAVYDDIAKFISGKPCTSESWKALQASTEWKNFAAGLEKSWAELEAKRLGPMKKWAQAELAEPNAVTNVLFYPFGGPDFLTAFLLFPNADTYVLLGLEFIGKLPEFDQASSGVLKHMEIYLANLNAALADFFNKSYFITKNMNATLTRDKVDGVLSVICFFLARTNNTILSIKRCEVMDKGEILDYEFTLPRKILRRPYGVKIEFLADGTNRLRTVYYFSCDLEDKVFTKDSAFYLCLDRLIFETTFIKSGSYLLHYKEFSNIRNLVLTKSRFVLEDDTGIPLRYFPAKDWEAQLYGEYIEPVSDFRGVEQFDLKAAYEDTARVKKLSFHLGYHWGSNKDSVLYFKRKNGGAVR